MIRLFFFVVIFFLFGIKSDREPLKADFSNSAAYRWLNKEVLDTSVLDEMESLDHWASFAKGAQQVVDARVNSKVEEANEKITRMTLSGEKTYYGNYSLQMTIPTKLDTDGPKSGRGWGTAGVQRIFDGEDWSNMNRISIWIYPDNPGFYVNWLELRIYNDGINKLPALFGQEGETSLLLRNNEWNHVVWEIGNVARDKVTSLEISYYLSGNEPEAADTANYYLDHLELQKVEPDYIEGWDVWPGRIAFSHTGYQTGAVKTAIVNNLKAREFKVIDEQTGETVLKKAVRTIDAHLGNYQVMDFSEVTKSGTYVIDVGGVRTKSFEIEPNVWRNTILKALNFFYVERCGEAIPGVHGTCHTDWICVHDNKKIVINGGWHDAGDLTQGLGNTAEAVYAMFSLAEYLNKRNDDPDLYNRVMEEAEWGLDWILKTSFRDGYRNGGSISSRRTNGIIGDHDDIVSKARNTPMDHFVASSAEAIGYRLLKNKNPSKATLSLKMAEEDWHYAVEGMAASASSEGNIFRGTFDSDNVALEVPSLGIIASVDLWKATGKQEYINYAIKWANVIVDSQQKTLPDWEVPMTGFFYTSPEKEHILHYCHHGREHSPILALTQLCEVQPYHGDWMKWYATVALHSEYLKNISKYTEPYRVMPASIYSDQEYKHAPESRRESYRDQVLNGISLGSGHYLKLFPVWMDYRGHFGTILPQAKALASAGNLRGDLSATQLAQHQLEWVIGRNPFAQSTMWGEGYDFPPLYTPLSGDMVGGLPVGIQTRGSMDVPYWPVQNSWTYKEIWSFPVISWISLIRNYAGPAIIEGYADTRVEFINKISEEVISVNPDLSSGKFIISLPQGAYFVRCGSMEFSRTFLPASEYQLDLRPGKMIDFEVVQTTTKKGDVSILLTAQGSGNHTFTIKADNLAVGNATQELNLRKGITATLEWRAHVVSKEATWIAVVVPDGKIGQRKEVMGSVWE